MAAVKINVKGAIIVNDYKEVYDFYEMESTCPNDILAALPEDNGPIELTINSGGGHLNAGSEIYYILKDYKGQVNVKIIALAASAASLIAMAGDHVAISPTAQIMIHNVSSIAHGDYNEMIHAAGVLKEMNRSIANAYILKTGKPEAEILDLMNKETWLSAKSAMQYGFVDEILGVSAENLSEFLVASSHTANLLPVSVIEKYREMKNSSNPAKPTPAKKNTVHNNFVRTMLSWNPGRNK
ncbi:Clp protease ClpP [Neobacillus piezotolerans]|uniref:ATP-dependent Clp protease proteolytic subunit n=1 Tax=Neobacillus piezotolerans TaxID=2259171 RepID=A0A3D8GML8_9BACI|nr:head maturation protease, ClpP-related [Neobacillus piezotolerans]RDU35479.1 Clp protease ClpP [Neobacillus piezotolerans]